METVGMNCTGIFAKYKSTRKTSFSPWLFLAATCFEETSSVPPSLDGKYYFRLTLWVWTLISTFLTNCYSCLMITDLNSPLPGARFEKWDDLLCNYAKQKKTHGNEGNHKDMLNINFHLLKLWHERGQRTQSENPYYSVDCFKLISNIETKSSGIVFLKFLEFLFVEYYQLSRNLGKEFESAILPRQTQILLSILNPKHGRLPKGIDKIKNLTEGAVQSLIESEIVDCSSKSAFMANSHELDDEHIFLSKYYYWLNFQKGKDTLYSTPTGNFFNKAGPSKIPHYYRSMLETGIYNRLLLEDVLSKATLRKPAVKAAPKPWVEGTLNGSLITLFVLYGCLSLTALAAFSWESRLCTLKVFLGTKKILKHLKWQKILKLVKQLHVYKNG
ncbi:hypothetical protein Fcan01_18048 [Folsomia candida]|uniref:Ionotropic glutamate receptor C-terminal domain-containing protein n=1 Tax=Folsomia candida TaxID=158441 RepID=A0A226DQI8_FOLCA|nr:hypothetical protein Fcan01_18048 [Folsomia candida]